MTRPLEIVCNANRDLFLGDFRGRLYTFDILNILDLSFEHLWQWLQVSFPFVSYEERPSWRSLGMMLLEGMVLTTVLHLSGKAEVLGRAAQFPLAS